MDLQTAVKWCYPQVWYSLYQIRSVIIIIIIIIIMIWLVQYETKVRFVEMLQEKQVNYEDDIKMTLTIIRHDDRFIAAGDRARHWLLHYFSYQRQVMLPNLSSNTCQSSCI